MWPRTKGTARPSSRWSVTPKVSAAAVVHSSNSEISLKATSPDGSSSVNTERSSNRSTVRLCRNWPFGTVTAKKRPGVSLRRSAPANDSPCARVEAGIDHPSVEFANGCIRYETGGGRERAYTSHTPEVQTRNPRSAPACQHLVHVRGTVGCIRSRPAASAAPRPPSRKRDPPCRHRRSRSGSLRVSPGVRRSAPKMKNSRPARPLA